MRTNQPRSAAAELVRLVGNIIYTLLLLVIFIMLSPIILIALIYRKKRNA